MLPYILPVHFLLIWYATPRLSLYYYLHDDVDDSSGENLITQMHSYFNFLAGSAQNRKGLWTSPYLDAFGLGLMVTHAIPCISEVDNSTIGVAGIDATLDEMETFLSHHQWGSVYSFLMNKQGETIFHPRLKPSTAVRMMD